MQRKRKSLIAGVSAIIASAVVAGVITFSGGSSIVKVNDYIYALKVEAPQDIQATEYKMFWAANGTEMAHDFIGVPFQAPKAILNEPEKLIVYFINQGRHTARGFYDSKGRLTGLEVIDNEE